MKRRQQQPLMIPKITATEMANQNQAFLSKAATGRARIYAVPSKTLRNQQWNGNLPKWLTTSKWINKAWDIHTTKRYSNARCSATQRNDTETDPARHACPSKTFYKVRKARHEDQNAVWLQCIGNLQKRPIHRDRKQGSGCLGPGEWLQWAWRFFSEQ